MNERLKAAIYVRVSTDEQRDKGHSIDEQIRILNEYCDKNNYIVVDVYNDGGYSGRTLERPNMQRMIKDCESGFIDTIIVLKVDRLSRDMYDSQWLCKFAKEHRIKIEIVLDNIDLTTRSGKMLFNINSFVGEMEVSNTIERTIRGLEGGINKGKYCVGRVPLGYKRTDENKIIPDEITAPLIQDIFNLYLNGCSIRKISKIMREQNRFTNGHGKWHDTKVQHILENPLYIGDFHYRRFVKDKDIKIFENFCDPIIDKDIFDQVQVQLDKNKHGGHGEKIHIFHQVIKCPQCSQLMRNYWTIKRTKKTSKEHFYVSCNNNNCDGKGLAYSTKKIEDKLITILNKITDYSIKTDYLLIGNNDKQKEVEKVKKVKGLDQQEDRILDLYSNNTIDINKLNSKINIIKEERKIILNKKFKLESESSFDYNYDLIDILENKNIKYTPSLNIIWDMLTRQGKKQIINKYLKFVEIQRTKNYQIEITNIEFNRQFLTKSIFNVGDDIIKTLYREFDKIKYKEPITLECFEQEYHNKKFHSFKEYLKKITENNSYKIYDTIDKNNIEIVPIINKNKSINDLKVITN